MSKTNVMTLKDLTDEAPTLRLRLTASDLATKKPKTDGTWTKITDFFEMCHPGQLKFEEKADKDTTERNKQKVKELFNKMKNHLDSQRDSILDTMDGMTAAQQEGIVTFWTEAYDFMINIIKYVRDVFYSVVEKIEQGFCLAKDTVKSFFASVMNLIRQVF